MADLNKRRGQIQNMEQRDGTRVITAQVPLFEAPLRIVAAANCRAFSAGMG